MANKTQKGNVWIRWGDGDQFIIYCLECGKKNSSWRDTNCRQVKSEAERNGWRKLASITCDFPGFHDYLCPECVPEHGARHKTYEDYRSKICADGYINWFYENYEKADPGDFLIEEFSFRAYSRKTGSPSLVRRLLNKQASRIVELLELNKCGKWTIGQLAG